MRDRTPAGHQADPIFERDRIALACDDVWSVLAVAVLRGVGLAVRIRAEERQLTQALGEEYERFAAGRKRLVPWVW